MFQRKSKAEQVSEEAVAAKDKAVAGVKSGAAAAREAFDEQIAPKASEVAEAAG
ncbi:MAG: hypothetical protein GX555_03270, partial [Actinomycetales bacterium]|nr:hypothetical protein [Actinomycetales bacterium]